MVSLRLWGGGQLHVKQARHGEFVTAKLEVLANRSGIMVSIGGNHVSDQPPSSESATSSFWPLFHYLGIVSQNKVSKVSKCVKYWLFLMSWVQTCQPSCIIS